MVENVWRAEEAAAFSGPIAERVYTSQLLGRDPALVLHGGGNTSVKVSEPDVTGERRQLLYVKGSGRDLADIDASGFAPVRLDRLRRLAELERLSDVEMARELRVATVDPAAPDPSVEAILHALFPATFVDHTHADAVVALTDTVESAQLVAELYQDLVLVVPYVMPGFRLARHCARLIPAALGPRTIGVVLLNHGVFSFGATARESYERMLHLVQLAEDHLATRRRRRPDRTVPLLTERREQLAELRRDVSAAAGRPMLLGNFDDRVVLDFVQHPRVGELTQHGPATPDHVIRTKPTPLLGRDVAGYAREYERYFARYRELTPSAGLQMLDPAPRVVLDPELGMCCAGATPSDVCVTADVYRHTIDVILAADELGGFRSIDPADLFEVEYWDLEQAKLRRRGAPKPLSGEAALVTGAASGIGRACAQALLAEGAAVVGVDRDPRILGCFNGPGWFGLQFDLTDDAAAQAVFEATVRRYGGLDILVLNAGVFPASRRIEHASLGDWREVMRINLDSTVGLLREAYPLLRLAPRTGRVVVIGSKNVPAPGPGAAAYSASKAGLTQLARVAALEWAGAGVRVNVIHPHGVFDTGAWTDDVLRGRAEQYGMTVDEYRTNNLLHVEVCSQDVAELCVAMVGPAFGKTTGAQVPVDGGSDRVL